MWINFTFTLFTTGTNDIIGIMFVQIHISNYMNLFTQISVFKNLIIEHKELVTNYGEGGATKRDGGGHMKFYPYENRGWKKF